MLDKKNLEERYNKFKKEGFDFKKYQKIFNEVLDSYSNAFYGKDSKRIVKSISLKFEESKIKVYSNIFFLEEPSEEKTEKDKKYKEWEEKMEKKSDFLKEKIDSLKIAVKDEDDLQKLAIMKSKISEYEIKLDTINKKLTKKEEVILDMKKGTRESKSEVYKSTQKELFLNKFLPNLMILVRKRYSEA